MDHLKNQLWVDNRPNLSNFKKEVPEECYSDKGNAVMLNASSGYLQVLVHAWNWGLRNGGSIVGARYSKLLFWVNAAKIPVASALQPICIIKGKQGRTFISTASSNNVTTCHRTQGVRDTSTSKLQTLKLQGWKSFTPDTFFMKWPCLGGHFGVSYFGGAAFIWVRAKVEDHIEESFCIMGLAWLNNSEARK